MDPVSTKKGTGSFGIVLVATTLVLVVPCLAAIALRASGIVTSPVLLIVIPVIFSILFSHALSEFWKHRRAGSPLLFEDLMLWGWLRRRRFESLLSRTEEFVGPGAGEGMTPKQRARELERLVGALEARDPRTHGHSRRVARHAASIARRMKLPSEEVTRIRTAALLHDVGKVNIPWEILDKPGDLTDQEYEVIKTHPVTGAEMVEGMGDPELAEIVRHHHERIDGAGYPDGLTRGQIPMGSRIIAVADTFDALTSARCYRTPQSHEHALEILRDEAGSQLDARAVRAFDGRYSSRSPVALAAAALGLGRQAGQSMVSIGTGATQVVAVGAAAAVIGAAPAVQIDRQDRAPDRQAVVREATTPGSLTAAETDGTPDPADAVAGRRSAGGDDQAGKARGGARIENRGGSTGADNTSNGTGSAGGATGPGDGGTTGTDTGSAGGSGGSTGSGGSSGGGSTGSAASSLADTTKKVTEAVQKPVQQVTQTVTEAVPTLPGDDPVSQGVNTTVGGVKDTIGKIVGKP